MRYDGNWFPERRRAELMESVHPRLVVDVGACVGQYIQEIRANGYDGEIVAFEPLEDAFRTLREFDDPRLSLHQVALGSQEGLAEINVSQNMWSSSLLPMSEAHLRAAPESAYIGRQRVEIRTLDSFELEPDWLKIDAQGYEQEVLAGASETLRATKAVELELSFASLYEGQPLASEVQAMLEDEGFRLAEFIKPFNDPETGFLLQVDAILMR